MSNFYLKVTEKTKRNRTRYRWVVICCQMLPWFFVAAFVVTLLILIASLNGKFIFFAAVPLASFILCTIVRNYLNFQRPFEVYQFEPVIEHKPGKSFPSRHTTMAFSIALSCFYINIAYGIIMIILSIVVAVTRVMCGLHFVRDVLAGFLPGLVFGALAFIMVAPWFGMGMFS